MIRGTVETIEERTAAEQAALDLVKAEDLAKAQAEAKATYDASIIVAKSEASTLSTSTAPVILAEVQKAQLKAPWLRAEVSNSKLRIETAIKEIQAIPDASERAARKASIENEIKTLKDWQIAYTPDPVAVRNAHIKYYRSIGKSLTKAQALSDSLIAKQGAL